MNLSTTYIVFTRERDSVCPDATIHRDVALDDLHRALNCDEDVRVWQIDANPDNGHPEAPCDVTEAWTAELAQEYVTTGTPEDWPHWADPDGRHAREWREDRDSHADIVSMMRQAV